MPLCKDPGVSQGRAHRPRASPAQLWHCAPPPPLHTASRGPQTPSTPVLPTALGGCRLRPAPARCSPAPLPPAQGAAPLPNAHREGPGGRAVPPGWGAGPRIPLPGSPRPSRGRARQRPRRAPLTCGAAAAQARPQRRASRGRGRRAFEPAARPRSANGAAPGPFKAANRRAPRQSQARRAAFGSGGGETEMLHGRALQTERTPDVPVVHGWSEWRQSVSQSGGQEIRRCWADWSRSQNIEIGWAVRGTWCHLSGI